MELVQIGIPCKELHFSWIPSPWELWWYFRAALAHQEGNCTAVDKCKHAVMSVFQLCCLRSCVPWFLHLEKKRYYYLLLRVVVKIKRINTVNWLVQWLPQSTLYMLPIVIPITMIVIKILKITGQIFTNTVLYTTHPGLNVTCVNWKKLKLVGSLMPSQAVAHSYWGILGRVVL